MSTPAFQSTVRLVQGFGVPGDLYSNAPLRSEPFQLAADCTVGFMNTVVSQGICTPGGTGVLAGLLFNSKVYALFGDGSDPLNPSLVVPAYTNVELLKEGEVVISVPADCAIGDKVSYATSGGALSTFKRTASFTAAQSTTTLTVSAIASGLIAIGSDVIDSTGAVIGQIIAQLTGSPGSTGTYQMSTSATVASADFTTVGAPADGYADAYGVITRFTPNGGSAQLAVADFNLPY